jgi:hypothetical protein
VEAREAEVVGEEPKLPKHTVTMREFEGLELRGLVQNAQTVSTPEVARELVPSSQQEVEEELD